MAAADDAKPEVNTDAGDTSLNGGSTDDAPAKGKGKGKSAKGENQRELVVKIFGTERHVGTFPARLHSDLRHLIEMFRRGKQSRLDRSRMDALETALAAGGDADMKSSGELRAQVDAWRSEGRRAFDADKYYDKDRTAGYTDHNRGSQEALSRRTLEIASFTTKRCDPGDTSKRESILAVDLGCGSGLSTLAGASLSSYNFGVIGIDLSSEMLLSEVWDEVKATGAPLAAERVKCDLAQPLPFRKGTFDAAYSVGAVHYIAQDATHRKAACRLDSFLGSLRNCMAENARPCVCQAFMTREMPSVVAFKEAAARTGWPLCELVQDKTHSGNTVERDFFYMVPHAKTKSGEGLERPPQCALYKEASATCALSLQSWAKAHDMPAVLVDSSHHAWLQREHDRCAKRLVRLRDRCALAGASLDHASPLDEAGKQMAEKLSPFVSTTPDVAASTSQVPGAADSQDPEGSRLASIVAALHTAA